MKTFRLKTALRALASAVALTASCAPALAAQVTWYVTGHMKTPAANTPADLLALAPAGSVFTASFSFDSASANNPIFFNSARTDFRSYNAWGASSLDVNGNHYSSTATSTIIEQADFNGESVTLNGGAVSGPTPAAYTTAALDVVSISHFGLGTAPQASKYPWFSPFGPGGTFLMISSAAPPDLSLSDNPAVMDLFFITADGGSYHLPGTIEAISTVPFPVPEPANWALMAGGLAVMGLLARRRQG